MKKLINPINGFAEVICDSFNEMIEAMRSGEDHATFDDGETLWETIPAPDREDVVLVRHKGHGKGCIFTDFAEWPL